MDTHHMRTFQRHARDQCLFLLKSAQSVNSAVSSGNINDVFYGIQNLLNAGANISKLLWGQGGRHAEERRSLRESVGIREESPLREVSMRNHFEHMDERVDRWWREAARHNIADKIIGPRSAIGGLEPLETFRWFDPVSADVIFWGDSFNIQALVAEVERILPRLEEEVNKPHWYEQALVVPRTI